MSPKNHLPKNKSGNKPTTSNELPISQEVAQQFELELCWCIQQLQTALSLGKLNPKQVQDHTKTLNTLMSNSAPMVKKRQVMRQAFGDYRAKMAQEDKKTSLVNAKMKVVKASPNTKSVFVKKSNYVPVENNSFKFKFSSSLDAGTSELKSSRETRDVTKFYFIPSNNSFRFNFGTDDN